MQVMVLFCDVVGFTSMSKEVEASQVSLQCMDGRVGCRQKLPVPWKRPARGSACDALQAVDVLIGSCQTNCLSPDPAFALCSRSCTS